MADRSGREPTPVGLRDGRLSPCPSTPNCVNSEDPDASRHVPPLRFDGPPEAAWQRLLAAVRSARGATVISESLDYVHAEFRTSFFRFVDDVEFRLDGPAGLIHVRSASRVGHSDLGVNRRRVENLRAAFDTAGRIERH